MRKVQRQQVSKAVQHYLLKWQDRVSQGEDVATLWEQAQKTKKIGSDLFAVLRAMAGRRERCMYCNDSRGTDIEHFWPKKPYPAMAFLWENMLLACTGCNRKKLNRLPLDANGYPLLIDPSAEDPWDFLDFVPETGELAPRWRLDLDAFDPKGETTTDPELLPLNIEAVTTGRQRCYRDLLQAIQGFLENGNPDDPGVTEAAFGSLLIRVLEQTDFGIGRWLFHFCDPEIDPLRPLWRDYPNHWRKLREATAQ